MLEENLQFLEKNRKKSKTAYLAKDA